MEKRAKGIGRGKASADIISVVSEKGRFGGSLGGGGGKGEESKLPPKFKKGCLKKESVFHRHDLAGGGSKGKEEKSGSQKRGKVRKKRERSAAICKG